MATTSLLTQAQDLQRELEGTLQKLEKSALLRPDAGDEIRTIVAEDIAGKLGERYRLFPCGPRQETLVIRRNALPPRCVLAGRLEEFSQRTAQQQQQQQPKKKAQRKKKEKEKNRLGVITPTKPPSPAQSIATSNTETKTTKAKVRDWVAKIPTDASSASTSTSPDKKTMAHEGTEDIIATRAGIARASSELLEELEHIIAEMKRANDVRRAAQAAAYAATCGAEHEGPGAGTRAEGAKVVPASAVVVKKEHDDDGDGYKSADNHEPGPSVEKDMEHGEEVNVKVKVKDEQEEVKEEEEDALSWLGLSAPSASLIQIDENEDLIDLGV